MPTTMYASGNYGWVELRQEDGTTCCGCGFIGAKTRRRILQCVCAHQPLSPLVVKRSWEHSLCQMLTQRQWGVFAELLRVTRGPIARDWPGCAGAKDLTKAVAYASQHVARHAADTKVYPKGSLSAILQKTMGKTAPTELRVVDYLMDEAWGARAQDGCPVCNDDAKPDCLENCLIPAWCEIKTAELHNEQRMADLMARLSPPVGPLVHPSLEALTLTTNFAGPTVWHLWQSQEHHQIKTGELLFAVYLHTEVLREARLRHNDLSLQNVCVEAREELIRFVGCWWRFPFRVRFIDCGFARSQDAPNTPADDDRLLRPDDLYKFGFTEDMGFLAHMDRCFVGNPYETTPWPRDGWHMRTVPWLRDHAFIDCLQFATLYRGFVTKGVRASLVTDFLGLVSGADFAALSLSERVRAVASCCSVTWTDCAPQHLPKKRRKSVC